MNLKSKIATLVLASTIALGAASPALAQETATTEGNVVVAIEPGTLSYSINSADFEVIDYNETKDTVLTGGLKITVNGNGDLSGWTLQVSATSFDYKGDAVDDTENQDKYDIPAENLQLTSVEEPVGTGGQAIVAAGPNFVGAEGGFNNPMKVITSGKGSGSGSYSQALGIELTVPAASQVGTYTSIVTLETTSAP